MLSGDRGGISEIHDPVLRERAVLLIQEETVMANTFHVSMYVEDLDRAIERYKKILGAEPAKVRPGYAKFELSDPPVIFSLVLGGQPGRVSHLGIRYPGTGEVASEMARSKHEGLDLLQQEGVTCCYAKADKYWVRDADGMPWEMYTLLADVEAETPDDPRLRSFLGQQGEEMFSAVAPEGSCCAKGSGGGA
jgi:catechol 2,3-dioxygenase-like lactoylglutathione lyase family enzyme